jgi:hypothetical protein
MVRLFPSRVWSELPLDSNFVAALECEDGGHPFELLLFTHVLRCPRSQLNFQNPKVCFCSDFASFRSYRELLGKEIKHESSMWESVLRTRNL